MIVEVGHRPSRPRSSSYSPRPLDMFPFYRSKKSEPFGNDPELEYVDDDENGGTAEEVDADGEETELPDVDDGIFVPETGRKRPSVAKAITYSAVGLAIAGTAFATGYGSNAAVWRSKNSPASVGVDEQTQAETPFPTRWPTYSPTAVEEAAVTVRPPESFACDRDRHGCI